MTIEEARALVGQTVVLFCLDNAELSGRASMAGRIKEVADDGYLVTDDGMEFQLEHIEHWEPYPRPPVLPAIHRLPPVGAYLSLGSNLGDRAANLWEAVRRLGELPDCAAPRISRLYESAPVGRPDQPWFLNAALFTLTRLSPRELLRAAQGIERDMGREPVERWGPRLIDIDILLYGDEVVRSDDLVVPHPELWNRRFVLVPLAELLPDGRMCDDMRAREQELRDVQSIRPWPRVGEPAHAG